MTNLKFQVKFIVLNYLLKFSLKVWEILKKTLSNHIQFINLRLIHRNNLF